MAYKNKLLSWIGTEWFIFSVIAITFGCWFACHQITAVVAHSFMSYPKQYFLLTILKCYCALGALFMLSVVILSHLSQGKIDAKKVAISYIPLVFVLAHVSVLWALIGMLAIQFYYLITSLRSNDYERLREAYLFDAMMLVFFFIFHLILTSRFSPLHWSMSILSAKGFNSEEIPVLVPVFKGFVLAKQFSFSNIDLGQWGGIMYPPVALTSPFMQLIEFIFDIPSASYQAFHTLIAAIYFTLMVGGSFGFYLFLRYAAQISKFFAFVGGLLLFFGGSPLLDQMFTSDGGIFLSPFAVFPYSLLFISIAFKKQDLRLAAWAGLALAAQLFFIAPHPEGVIYSLMFFSCYVFGMFIFSWNVKWGKRLVLAATPIISFFLLTSFFIAPLMYDKLMGNMFVLAHTNDINYTYISYFKSYILLLCIFVPISFLLQLKYKKISSVYLSSLFLAGCLLTCIYVMLDAGLIAKVIHIIHLGLHIWVPSRIGIYFYMSTYIIAMFGLSSLTHYLFQLAQYKYQYNPVLERK